MAVGSSRTLILAFAAALALAALAVLWMLQSAPPAATRSPAAAPNEPLDSGADGGRSSTRAITPGAFSESEPAEGAATSRAGMLEIEVVDWAARPAAKAWIVLRRGDDALGAGQTDAEGVGRLKAGEGEADLVIIPRGAPALGRKIPISPGRIRVELPAGVSISGRVEVNGGVPRDPVGFRISGPEDPVLDGIVWNAVPAGRVFSCVTSSSGTFEIAGLRPGSEWRLETPQTGYVLDEMRCDGNLVSKIAAPASAVVVKLSRFPVVRLRAVSIPDKKPVAETTCEVFLKGPAEMRGYYSAGSDGRLEFVCANIWNRSRASRAELTLRSPDAVRRKLVVLEPAPEEDRDLGDVELPSVRTVACVVRDPAGAPIERAFVHVADGQPDPRSPTDAQGRTTLLLPSEEVIIRAGALKYEIAEITVPPDCKEPFVVTLRPTGGIEVRLHTPPGTPADAVLVRLTAETEEAFAGKMGEGGDPIYIASGAAEGNGGSWGDGRSEFSYVPDASARVVIAGVKPGIAVALAAVDRGERVVLASSIVTLQPSEWRTVDLEVTKAARSVRGRVRDLEGKPIEGAVVQIRQAFLTQTDADGRFVLTGLFESGAFYVSKAGFVVYGRRDFVLPPEGEELDIRLQPACKLTVKVVDARGAPMRDVQVWIVVPGNTRWTGAPEKAPGVHESVEVPPDLDVELKAIWAEHEWSRSIRTRSESVEVFTLPVAGKLRLDLSAIAGDEFELELASLGEKPKMSWYYVRPAEGSPRERELASVPPGEYRAQLHRSEEGRPLAALPQTVTVKSGETTRIVFKTP